MLLLILDDNILAPYYIKIEFLGIQPNLVKRYPLEHCSFDKYRIEELIGNIFTIA